MKIGIVGGGLSGLYLAYRLSANSDNDVVLYEKESSIGGRIYTTKVADQIKKGDCSYLADKMSYSEEGVLNSIQYECGAGRFTKEQPELMALFKELDIDHSGFIPITSNFEFRKQNGHIEDDRKYLQLIGKVVKAGKDVKYLHKLSFYNYLTHILTDDEIRYFKETSSFTSEFLKMNATDCLDRFKYEYVDNPQFYILKDGLSTIITRLLAKCNNRSNCKLVTSTEIETLVKQDGKYLLNGDIECDKVIVTLNPGDITFPIFDRIQEYLDYIEVHRLMRIYVVFRKDKMGNVWFKGKKRCKTDNILQFLIPVSEENGLMMIYVEDDYCDIWLDSEDNGTLADDIKREFGKLYTEDIGEVLYANCHYWDTGTHYNLSNVDTKRFTEGIAKPYVRQELYLANEAYSLRKGWINSSLESCNRVLDNF